ncbi:MAG: hypothetical protein C0467_08290 [Planctomycetaceae bacterium]|nr:hypothetical protein [Planctomycetaceae bacterium]
MCRPLATEPSGNASPQVQPDADSLAPADLVRRPGTRERFAWYAGTMLLSCILVFWGLRLDVADFRAPFYYDLDALLMMPLVKATVERGVGGHWQNEKMGAPGILELYDFPVIDHLHLFIIWLLGHCTSNLSALYNTYFLLTFPLTVLTTMIAFRHLGLTLTAASVGGILFAFLPFHYQRWENHYFLAAYWMIPLALLPAFDITLGKLPFCCRLPDGTWSLHLRSWRTFRIVLLALATSAAGAYYAFFTCAIIAFGGLYALVAFRSVRPLFSAGAVVAMIVGFGVANHIPTYIFQAKYGRHPITNRFPEEADYYGLKISHMILPTEDHNLRVLNEVKSLYNSAMRPSETENRSASLGFVATFGLLGLVALALLPLRRPWPYGPLVGMTVFTVLLATIGGFGSVFNLLVTAQIRGYNRISVFTAFLCLFAFLWAFDRLWAKHPKGLPARYLLGFAIAFLAVCTMSIFVLDTGMRLFLLGLCGALWLTPAMAYAVFRYRSPETLAREVRRFPTRILPRWFQYVAWGTLLLLGFFDQTPFSWFRSGIVNTIDEHASRFRDDSLFFQRIEHQMPPGSKIFCLPYCPFPETAAVHRMQAYEHARGYLHTNGLLWSFGAMKGREADNWQQDVGAQPVDEFLRRIVFRGFDGLLIDQRGYAITKEGNRAAVIVSTIHHLYANLAGQPSARLPEIIHTDRDQFFLDLRPYRDLLRQKLSIPPFDFETYARKERELPSLLWLAGFYTAVDEHGEQQSIRRGTFNATAWFVNPTDRTRTFTVSLVFGTESPGTFQLKLTGLINDDLELDRRSPTWDAKQFGIPRKYTVEVPPGRHRINLRCTPPADFIPGDIRKLCYYVLDIRIDEN